MNLFINKNSYYIPGNWNELPLGRYIDFMTTYKEDASDAEQEIHLLATLSGAPLDVLGEAKKSTLNKAIDRLKELLLKECGENLVLEFEIDGVAYGFHPNLSQLKLKEFVDLDNKLEKGWENMHEVMAILYRPITENKGKKYKLEEYDYIKASKRAQLFKTELSVEVVNGAASFFLSIAVDYMKIIRAYSKMNRQQRRHATRQMKSSLQKNMAGTA